MLSFGLHLCFVYLNLYFLIEFNKKEMTRWFPSNLVHYNNDSHSAGPLVLGHQENCKTQVSTSYLLFSYCALKPGKKLSDVETDVVCDNPPNDALNSVNKNEDMEVEVYPDSDVEDPDVSNNFCLLILVTR